MGDFNSLCPDLVDYCARYCSREPETARRARAESRGFDNAHWVLGTPVGTLLRVLVRLTAPREVLEIGCFTGYATAMILEELRPGARLTSLDTSKEHLDAARNAVSPLPQEVATRFICDDGFSWLARTSRRFDFVLLDARKDGIHDSYELIANALTSGGVLVVDNALLQGSVLKPERGWEVATDLFNKRLAADSAFLATLLPVRDGLNLAIKI